MAHALEHERHDFLIDHMVLNQQNVQTSVMRHRLLTLGLRNAGVLILLLVLPLCIPVLIFGAGAVAAIDTGLSPRAHLYLLGALLLLTSLGAPIASAAALRISAA